MDEEIDTLVVGVRAQSRSLSRSRSRSRREPEYSQ